MPVITMTMGEAPEKTKRDLITRLTATAAEVTSLGEDHFIVFIEELKDENIGIGGKDLKTAKAAR